jgi:hypothetical protein
LSQAESLPEIWFPQGIRSSNAISLREKRIGFADCLLLGVFLFSHASFPQRFLFFLGETFFHEPPRG